MNEIEVCRVCANSTSFASSTKLFDRRQRSLLGQLKDITGCSLKNSKLLPKIICEYCEESLKQAYQFRKRCQDSQLYFLSDKYKDFIQTQGEVEFKSEVDDDIENTEKDEQIESDAINLFEPDSKAFDTVSIDEGPPDEKCAYTNNANLDEVVKLESVEIFKIAEVATTTPKKVKGKRSQKISNNTKEKPIPKVKKQRGTGEKTDLICDQCGNHFTCRHHFKTHLRRHANDKRYQCEVCPDKFFTHSELTRHMRRHTGERPFACQHCQRRFTDHSTRIKHERTHTNERPFKCSHCGKAFTTSYVLKNHMLTHTGERSFKCEICDKAFQRDVHLVVHYRSLSHKQMAEKQMLKVELNKKDASILQN